MARTFAVLLVLTVAAACGSAGPLGPSRPSGPPSAAGTTFRLWQDAAILTAVQGLLSAPRAGQPLWVEMYEFDRPDLAAALVQARARGADVKLIVDPTVPESARTAEMLAAAGVPVRTYPVDDRRYQIDHVKLLVSNEAALVAGMNWGRRSAVHHDYALETRAPAVLARLRAVFEQDWSLAGGRPAPLPQADGPVAQTAPGEEVRARLLAAVRQARRSITAEVFVLTDPWVMAELSAADRRGVRVRVLLDPEQVVNRAGFRLLRAAGVEVRWYAAPEGTKMHAKAGLFDGQLLVGSANWSQGGLSVNHELDLLAEDPEAAAAFAARFELDWVGR